MRQVREQLLTLTRWTNETVLRRVLRTPSIANSLCTRLGHGQVERHPYALDLVGMVLVVAWQVLVSKEPVLHVLGFKTYGDGSSSSGHSRQSGGR